jgi:SOS-response transcriptional repressor LexA
MKKRQRLSKKKSGGLTKLPYREFGKLFRTLRLRMGLSQVDIAKHLALHSSYVSRLEYGERRPSPKVLKKMSELTGYGLDSLLVVCGLTEDNGTDREATYERMVSLRREVEELRRRVGQIAQGQINKDAPRGRRTGLRAIPVFDAVPAGILLPASEAKTKAVAALKLPETVLREHPDAFALVATGDSMVDAGILNGDTVVISPTAKVKSGDIAVVALRDHDISLKTVYFEDNKAVLHAANRNYRPVILDYPDDIEIIGKAMLVWRELG